MRCWRCCLKSLLIYLVKDQFSSHLNSHNLDGISCLPRSVELIINSNWVSYLQEWVDIRRFLVAHHFLPIGKKDFEQLPSCNNLAVVVGLRESYLAYSIDLSLVNDQSFTYPN